MTTLRPAPGGYVGAVAGVGVQCGQDLHSTAIPTGLVFIAGHGNRVGATPVSYIDNPIVTVVGEPPSAPIGISLDPVGPPLAPHSAAGLATKITGKLGPRDTLFD